MEDFAWKACDAMCTRDERTGLQFIKGVWSEMAFEVLIPRLQRLGLISPRLEPRYREIGLLG